MAKLYTDASGALLRCDVTPGQLQQAAPANTASTLDFDPDANDVLLVNIVIQPLAVRYDGATVTIGGQAYSVQAASTDYQQSQQIISRGRTAIGDMTTYLALTSPTNAQNVAELQLLTRAVRWLLHEALLD